MRSPYFLLFFLLLGAAGPALAQTALLVSDLCVAPDAQVIAFATNAGSSNDAFGIYEQPLKLRGRARRISSPERRYHCFAPAYSPDGRYLLYLRELTRAGARRDYADLLLFDRASGFTQVLTTEQQLITQAVFAPDGQRIIYLAASTYGSLTRGGTPAPHHLDVYSMDLTGHDQRRHSTLAAYVLGNLALLRAPDTYLLTAYDPRRHLAGTYAYSLADTTRLRYVPDSAATSRHLPYLPNPVVSDDMRVGYAIGSEVYIKNMRTGRSRLLYVAPPGSDPRPLAFLPNQGMLLFSQRFYTGYATTHRIGILDTEQQVVRPLELNVE